jgi:hypothetical protein
MKPRWKLTIHQMNIVERCLSERGFPFKQRSQIKLYRWHWMAAIAKHSIQMQNNAISLIFGVTWATIEPVTYDNIVPINTEKRAA